MLTFSVRDHEPLQRSDEKNIWGRSSGISSQYQTLPEFLLMEHPGVKQMTWWELLSVGLRLPCWRDLWRLSWPLSERDVGLGGVALSPRELQWWAGCGGGMLVREGSKDSRPASRIVVIILAHWEVVTVKYNGDGDTVTYLQCSVGIRTGYEVMRLSCQVWRKLVFCLPLCRLVEEWRTADGCIWSCS